MSATAPKIVYTIAFPKTHMQTASQPRWISEFIIVGVGCFLLALFLSALLDPRIRLLHALQALIYVAVFVLARRSSAWGYGAGFLISVFWNYINLWVTSFIWAGAQQWWIFLRTGHLHRPDLAIALVAAIGHFLLIIACLAGFLRMRPRAKQWIEFIVGGLLAIGYFVLIIVTTGRQYIPLLKRVFHL